MDDYWKEVENITSSEGAGAGRAEGEAQEEEQQKTPEGDTGYMRRRSGKDTRCTVL